MSKNQPIYVLDTNVLVDYADIIPTEDGKRPVEPTIALDQAHIVIPTAVIRELEKFKTEKTDRGKSARTVLRRLRRLIENNHSTMHEVYNLDAPIVVKDCFADDLSKIEDPLEIQNSKQIISVLPVHKNFRDSLPYYPDDGDMDGQIILTALAVGMIQHKMPIDGSTKEAKVEGTLFDDVVLVTNDNGLAIRARERGLKTSRYGYKYPKPYTGRRDLVVPAELFKEFYNSGNGGISRELFEQYMPDEPKLIANEFIVMKVENEEDYPPDFDPENNPYFSNIGRYDSENDTITGLRYASCFPVCLHNAGQAIYAEALMDPEIAAVVCTGPAGSGKTYMATVYGYLACKKGEFIGVTVVPCDSKDQLGALPGDLDEKMDPEVQPLKNALRNYLLNEDKKLKKELETLQKFGTDAKKKNSAQDDCEDVPEKRSLKAKLNDRANLIWDNWFSNIPIEHARGRDFSYELALYDEFQDQNVSQADTLIKRLGTDGKIVIIGDIEQIHAPYIDPSSSGLAYASRQLMDSPMVAQVCFTEDEVIRHPLVKMVAMRQKTKSSL
ncbi:PhoH family protein [Candidatus Saccharibacteria bacterium]|nr:PhoH family protein [Candidatus Saccharibacteria bacterium]